VHGAQWQGILVLGALDGHRETPYEEATLHFLNFREVAPAVTDLDATVLDHSREICALERPGMDPQDRGVLTRILGNAASPAVSFQDPDQGRSRNLDPLVAN